MTTDISKKLTGFLTEYSNSLTRIEAEKSLMNGTPKFSRDAKRHRLQRVVRSHDLEMTCEKK